MMMKFWLYSLECSRRTARLNLLSAFEFEGVKGLHPLQARHLAQVADSLYPFLIGRGYSL
ncbi:hypothetical protein B6517_10260 [Campylobacter coli]|nr:hypothetical protein [Campylobacter coli]